MGKINVWLQKRELQKKEAEPVMDFPQSIEKLLLSFDLETRILLKSYLSKNGKVDLEKIESFIRNPDSINHLSKGEPKFYQDFIKEKYLLTAKKLVEDLYYFSAQDLSKAIHPDDFKESIEPHIDDNGKAIVDHKDQMEQMPAHPEYLKMLKDPYKFGSIPFDEGISAKMIHKKHGYTDKSGDFVSYGNPEQHSTFMTKPYHPLNDDAELTRFPLHGWATMATKSLFNAGNIGHLAEDVGVHEINNRPVTVHKFNDKADQMATARFDDHNYDPLEVHQIGVMDYLANNLDRHIGNVMVHKDDKGKSHLMGIDHERNFVYQDTLKGHNYDAPETALSYSSVRGLEHPLNNSNFNQPVKPLLAWWKKHGMNIQKEFAKQTSSIKDPAIRKHVYDNFMGRWERMNDWANQTNPNDSYRDLHNVETFEEAPIKKFTQPINAKILAALPKNPRDAVAALFDIVNRKDKLTPQQSTQIKDTLSNIVKKLDPKELSGIYKDSLDNPNWQVYGGKGVPNIRSIILDHLLKPEEYHKNKPLYKLNHIKAIADTIDSLPEEHHRGLIQKEQAKKLRGLISKVTRRAA